MGHKSIEELRQEVAILRKKRTINNERSALIKEKRELKFGKAIATGKAIGRGFFSGFSGLKAVDRFVTPQLKNKRRRPL